VTYKAEIMNIAEYLNTKCAEDQFVNIVNSNKSIQPNVNSTIKMAAKAAEELNQMRTVTQKGRYSTHISKIRRLLKKMGK
jgi:hypothetical protein